jgi:hypothetical protein
MSEMEPQAPIPGSENCAIYGSSITGPRSRSIRLRGSSGAQYDVIGGQSWARFDGVAGCAGHEALPDQATGPRQVAGAATTSAVFSGSACLLTYVFVAGVVALNR